MNAEILKSCEELVALLKQKELKIATAESCTGGMLSTYITAVAGASKVFELGVTSYSNQIKNTILKVDDKTLTEHGAVSKQTALQMAKNVRNIANADIGVSVTGVAGPDGQDGYDAGVVFVGISDKNTTHVHKLQIEPLNRNFVRETAVLKLTKLIIKFINN